MNNPLHTALRNFKPSNELAYAREVIQMTLEQLKLENLLPKITIEFNNRFTNKAGDAKLIKNAVYTKIGDGHFAGTRVSGWDYGGRIRLGSKYFAIAPEADKLETIVHETCHIAYNYYYMTTEYEQKICKYDSHGIGWKGFMERVGYPNANPCHTLDTRQFKNYYKLTCVCGHNQRITAQMGGRIINSKNKMRWYVCPKCNIRIKAEYLTKFHGSELVYGTENH